MFKIIRVCRYTVCPVCPVTSLCELISRVLEKIERIHNMPRKAEHLSFQGKKDFENQSMGYGVISFFCEVTPILSVRIHFSIITPIHVSEP